MKLSRFLYIKLWRLARKTICAIYPAETSEGIVTYADKIGMKKPI